MCVCNLLRATEIILDLLISHHHPKNKSTIGPTGVDFALSRQI